MYVWQVIRTSQSNGRKIITGVGWGAVPFVVKAGNRSLLFVYCGDSTEQTRTNSQPEKVSCYEPSIVKVPLSAFASLLYPV